MGIESVSFVTFLEGFNIIFWNAIKVVQINHEDANLDKVFFSSWKKIF